MSSLWHRPDKPLSLLIFSGFDTEVAETRTGTLPALNADFTMIQSWLRFRLQRMKQFTQGALVRLDPVVELGDRTRVLLSGVVAAVRDTVFLHCTSLC